MEGVGGVRERENYVIIISITKIIFKERLDIRVCI